MEVDEDFLHAEGSLGAAFSVVLSERGLSSMNGGFLVSVSRLRVHVFWTPKSNVKIDFSRTFTVHLYFTSDVNQNISI